ncbi:conserved protein of unknown function [Candidatus Methylacidiphilum fumarolicum]|nr:conserved protein of unknown function [Candidatus Methylacidiphilum fumarolicum]
MDLCGEKMAHFSLYMVDKIRFLVAFYFLWFPSWVHAQVDRKDIEEILVDKEQAMDGKATKTWAKDLFIGFFSGGFWPSVSRTSASAYFPTGRIEHAEGYTQPHAGYFGGLYLGYDFKEAAIGLFSDKRWKAIPAVAFVLNYGQISSSGFSYNSLSATPSYANGTSQSFIPEIAGVVNFSNATRFVPFVGVTLGAALNWLIDESILGPHAEELLVPGQSSFALAFTSKLIGGLAVRLFPHWDLIIAYTTRFIAPMDFTFQGSPQAGFHTLVSHSGWYQDFEGWGAIQYNFWP